MVFLSSVVLFIDKCLDSIEDILYNKGMMLLLYISIVSQLIW